MNASMEVSVGECSVQAQILNDNGSWSAAFRYRDEHGVTEFAPKDGAFPTLLALDGAALEVIRESRIAIGDDHAEGALSAWRKATAKARELAA